MAAVSAAGPDLAALDAGFHRTLRTQNKSDRTVEAYTDAVRRRPSSVQEGLATLWPNGDAHGA
jgi:hypothetical protein